MSTIRKPKNVAQANNIIKARGLAVGRTSAGGFGIWAACGLIGRGANITKAVGDAIDCHPDRFQKFVR